MGEMPDMTLTLAVAALFAEGSTAISGVDVLRHHETDRLAAATRELRKLGATVEERPDGLLIEPPSAGLKPGVSIDTYDDHRMAMAFSMVGDVVIRGPGCVAKTFPDYFAQLERLGMVATPLDRVDP
jgi:3-phosphoshikimate 1-carboxyvinyltransferase